MIFKQSVLIAARGSCYNPSQLIALLCSDSCHGSICLRKKSQSSPCGPRDPIGLGPCHLSYLTYCHLPPHSLFSHHTSFFAVPQMCQAHSHLKVFAQTVLFVWITLPPDIIPTLGVTLTGIWILSGCGVDLHTV